MADEPSQAPEDQESLEDASQDETRVEETADSDVNWEQRYKDTQAAFTRESQQRAEYEQILDALQDPEQQAEALRQYFNLELQEAEEGGEEEYQDPVEELEQRLAQLEQERGQEQEAAQSEQLQEAEFAFIDQQLAAIEKEAGVQFDDDEANTIGTLALQLRNDQGAPDVQGAYERIYKTVLEKQRSRWTDSKRQAQQAPVGVPGSEKVNLKDDQTRRRLLAEAMEVEEDSG
jgi:hypothetical protein